MDQGERRNALRFFCYHGTLGAFRYLLPLTFKTQGAWALCLPLAWILMVTLGPSLGSMWDEAEYQKALDFRKWPRAIQLAVFGGLWMTAFLQSIWTEFKRQHKSATTATQTLTGERDSAINQVKQLEQAEATRLQAEAAPKPQIKAKFTQAIIEQVNPSSSTYAVCVRAILVFIPEPGDTVAHVTCKLVLVPGDGLPESMVLTPERERVSEVGLQVRKDTKQVIYYCQIDAPGGGPGRLAPQLQAKQFVDRLKKMPLRVEVRDTVRDVSISLEERETEAL